MTTTTNQKKGNNWWVRLLLKLAAGTLTTAFLGAVTWGLLTIVCLQAKQAAGETRMAQIEKEQAQQKLSDEAAANAIHRLDRNVGRLCDKLGVKYEEPK